MDLKDTTIIKQLAATVYQGTFTPPKKDGTMIPALNPLAAVVQRQTERNSTN